MPRAADLVLLARLEAQLTETPHTVLTKHIEGDLHTLLERDPRPLGRGGFGEVYREECTEGSPRGSLRAVKLIQRPNARQLRNIDLSRELEAIARFSQPQYEPYFTKCFGWYETSNTVFIAMEFLEHGDLQSCSGNPSPEREMQSIASQVLEGLYFMHSQGYAHRDLKPQNLLVYRPRPHWHIKIADFGLSKRVAESFSSLHTQAGTQGYMAPEVMGLLDDDDSDDGLTPSYTTAVDIWALGVVTFYMLTGHLPFPASDLRPLERYIRGKTSFPIQVLRDEKISDAGCTWVESCMAPSPPDRPSAGYSRRHDWPMGRKLSISATEALQSSIASSGIATASWTAPDSTFDADDTQAAADNIVTLGNTVSVEAPVHNASKKTEGSETSSSASPRSLEQATQAHIPKSASSLHTTSETPTGDSEDTVMQQHNTVDAQIPGHQYPSSLWTQHVTLSADDEVIGTICGTNCSPQRVWLCLWSTDTGKLLLNQSLELQASRIRDKSTLESFASGPSALVVALLTDDSRIHVWSLTHNGTQQSPPVSVYVEPSYSSQRDFLQFSRNGKLLVHHGKMARIFDPGSMSLVRAVDLDLDDSSYGSQTITPDGQFLAYTSPARYGTNCGRPRL
ncbi:hypothetical protein CBER1_02014 [Cercospora berteroae]|uniref:mitogen-activated protein kinase kinase n=1 Tax=Cercospora berteroae TaxID=357750 RepID=A0A2S6CMK1_9PEZI|nr:hypothetical protein CBER1_02014 [Cercospora berteroae]